MKKLLIVFCCAWAVFTASAQTDSARTYNVGVMLPFQTQSTLNDISDFFNAPDFFTASRISLNNYSEEALDFYQGMLLALNTQHDSIHINLHVYDCWNNDSVTEAWLKKPELKQLDVLVGPSSTANARIAAEFCLKNKILNIQPFTPSKSLTLNNPYHIKLAPTIDAHVDNIFASVLDSFEAANVLIYAPDNEIGTATATRFDSLFKEYNKTATQKFSVSNLNFKKISAEKKKLSDYLKQTKCNVVIITAFEGSFVNNTLRLLTDNKGGEEIVIYGMPTWLNSEVMRLDYLNNFNTCVTEGFYADTTRQTTVAFATQYKERYHKEPTPMSYSGYDATNYLIYMLSSYGKEFPEKTMGERYIGAGYKYDVVKQLNAAGNIDYYENRHVNVFRIENYRLKKIW